MTIVSAHQLDMQDLQILGNNTAEAIRLDHEELQAGNRERYSPYEPPAEPEPEYDN